MKIKQEYVSNPNDAITDINDISKLLNSFKKQYRNVFIYNIGEQIFFYRTLTRKEHKIILDSKEINDFEKEEVICETCILWPENYNFETCDAGVPTNLCKVILKNSFLDSIDSRIFITNFYRSEMFDAQNQIPCIINEAFPHFDIEEIEDWDMDKTAKYLSRAEWKLVNLRGATITTDPDTYLDQSENNIQQDNNEQQNDDKNSENNKTLIGTKKEKLTPEKLRELQAKFPEIDWAHDAVLEEGVKALDKQYDIVSPALRPGF